MTGITSQYGGFPYRLNFLIMLNIYTFPSTNHRWKTSLFQWLNWIRHFDERTCRVFYVYHLEYEFTLRKSSLYCKTFVYVRSKILKTECIDNQKDTKAIQLHLDLWSVIIVHDSSNGLWTRLDLCCAVFFNFMFFKGKEKTLVIVCRSNPWEFSRVFGRFCL